MGWFSSICSSVGSCFRSACGAIGSAVKGVCNFVTNSVSSIANVASTISVISKVLAVIPGMQPLSGFLAAVSKAAFAVAVMCKVFSPNEKIEDIGERALQAEENGITLEKCENDFNLYMEKLRNMELDPNKKHDINECRLAGALVAEKGISLQNAGLSLKYLTPLMLFKDGLVTPEKAVQWGKIAKDLGFSYADVAKFYLGEKNFDAFFGPKEKGNITNGAKVIITAERELNPDKSLGDIDKENGKIIKDLGSVIDESVNNFNEKYADEISGA